MQIAEFLLVQENVGVLQRDSHLFGIGDEIRRKIPAIELHAFDDVELGLGRLGLLDGDHTLVADLFHRLSDHVANGGVAIGGNRAHLGNFVGRIDLRRPGLDVLDDFGHRQVDAALQIHRVHAGGDQLGAFAQDGSGKDRCRSGAVAGEIIGLGCHLAHQLRAHVLEFVLELDLLGDGDAVLGDARRAVGLVEDDVASLRAERHLDGIVENFDTAQHAITRIGGKFDFLGRHDFRPVQC